jgi:16S rRNA (uracil1498-N3)-methyltransferase
VLRAEAIVDLEIPFSSRSFGHRPRILAGMAERFYANCPLGPGPLQLDGAEAHHLAGVRRFRVGDAVVLFNGDGAEYPATVTEVAKRSVVLEISERRSTSVEVGREIEVAAPLPKGDRTAFLIEKLTEIGVTSFVPLRCERSVIDPGEGKLEKLERAVIEASKQCGRNTLMRIEPPVDWRDYVPARGDEERYIAVPVLDERWGLSPPKTHGDLSGFPVGINPTARPTASVRLAVGPEGGFTAAEVALAAGWRRVALGPRILRVETAALVLAAHFTTPVD